MIHTHTHTLAMGQTLDQFEELDELVSITIHKYQNQASDINISTTVHAMTKPFVPFCSAQDGKSADMNCLVF